MPPGPLLPELWLPACPGALCAGPPPSTGSPYPTGCRGRQHQLTELLKFHEGVCASTWGRMREWGGGCAQTLGWLVCPLLGLQPTLFSNCARNETPPALEGTEQLSPPPARDFFLAHNCQHSGGPEASLPLTIALCKQLGGAPGRLGDSWRRVCTYTARCCRKLSVHKRPGRP